MFAFPPTLVFVADIEDGNVAHLTPKYKLTKKKKGMYFEVEIREWLKN